MPDIAFWGAMCAFWIGAIMACDLRARRRPDERGRFRVIQVACAALLCMSFSMLLTGAENARMLGHWTTIVKWVDRGFVALAAAGSLWAVGLVLSAESRRQSDHNQDAEGAHR